jgi:transcriptional regulator with XRE-family HTH domain
LVDAASQFGLRLREWRESNGLKISAVAAELGVATSSWGHWETGHSLPSGANLILLTIYTGIPLQHFVCPNSHRCPFAKSRK